MHYSRYIYVRSCRFGSDSFTQDSAIGCSGHSTPTHRHSLLSVVVSASDIHDPRASSHTPLLCECLPIVMCLPRVHRTCYLSLAVNALAQSSRRRHNKHGTNVVLVAQADTPRSPPTELELQPPQGSFKEGRKR